jgi:hypothetical protein
VGWHPARWSPGSARSRSVWISAWADSQCAPSARRPGSRGQADSVPRSLAVPPRAPGRTTWTLMRVTTPTRRRGHSPRSRQRPAAAEVVSLVTTAVQRRMTTPDRLRSRLEQRTRHAHRALLIGMLADVAEGAESPLELRYLRTVERPHGLPRGDRQNSRAGLRYIRDVLYEEFGLLVELDGRDGHQDIGRFRDMNRDNLHALRDELTLRFGWFDSQPEPVP